VTYDHKANRVTLFDRGRRRGIAALGKTGWSSPATYCYRGAALAEMLNICRHQREIERNQWHCQTAARLDIRTTSI
jgi:hypothetical protein